MNIKIKEFFGKAKGFLNAKLDSKVAKVLAVFIVALIVFGTGVSVGAKKARFSCEFADNYRRMFVGQDDRGRGMPGMFRDDFMAPHGVAGRVISRDPRSALILGRDGIERSVFINKDTIVKRFQNDAFVSDLIPGDDVVVVGAPGIDSRFDAKFIRLMPRENASSTAGTTTNPQ